MTSQCRVVYRVGRHGVSHGWAPFCAGHTVTVFNRSAHGAEAWQAEYGGQVASSRQLLQIKML